jgi:hypothetical protein
MESWKEQQQSVQGGHYWSRRDYLRYNRRGYLFLTIASWSSSLLASAFLSPAYSRRGICHWGNYHGQTWERIHVLVMELAHLHNISLG